MTVDSEITRIQTAKCCMRQALIDKGVSVASDLSLDCYACCIDSIATCKYAVKYMLVGGGGGGGGCKYLNYSYIYLGGGGGGAVCFGGYLPKSESFCVSIGSGGVGSSSSYVGQPGGSTYIGPSDNRVTAPGGQGPNAQYVSNPGCYEAWGGASGSGCVGGRNYCVYCYSACYGGGGAGGVGCVNGSISGGPGICGYGGGGGGVRSNTGIDGGGVGKCCGCPDATNCGGGGGGACGSGGGKGAGGLAEICYPTDGSYGIHCATGGSSCFTCDGYCVHRFTSSGTFCIVC